MHVQDFWSIEKERVYLVGVNVKSESRSRYSYNVHESLEELGRLADTAGLKVSNMGCRGGPCKVPCLSQGTYKARCYRVAGCCLCLQVQLNST